jgi:putative DNA primase/helicase
MYDTARYITVTGQRLPNTPAEIRVSQEILNQIHTSFIRPSDTPKSPARIIYQPQPLTNREIIDKALRARNGAKFCRLWAGDTSHYESPSEAHLALCAMLIYWTNGDVHKAEDLFKESGQFDDETEQKWNERHSADGKTYGQMTIEKARATSQNYTRQRSPKRS